MTEIARNEVYRLAVAFLANLAYPLTTKAEIKRRNNFIAAMESKVGRTALRDGVSRLDVPAKYRMELERQRGAISRAEGRLQSRRHGAYAIIVSLVENKSAAQATVNVMKKAHEMGLVAGAWKAPRDVKASNAQKLLRPALANTQPDALAFAEVMEAREHDGKPTTLPDLLDDPKWIFQVFNLREKWIGNLHAPVKQNRGRPKT